MLQVFCDFLKIFLTSQQEFAVSAANRYYKSSWTQEVSRFIKEDEFMKNMVRTQGQAGFSLLGVLIAVMIIGIIAAMAVPRLESAITTANTSRIKADLSTLDSAIGVYEAENGKAPTKLADLSEYVRNAGDLTPPTGTYWSKSGVATPIPTGGYTIAKDEAGKVTEVKCGTTKPIAIGDLGSKKSAS